MTTKALAQESELVLAQFHVSINEGALQNVREASIVDQVTRAHGKSASERLAWIRKHSPCSSGARVSRGMASKGNEGNMRCAIGNSEWSRQIKPSCEKPEALNVTKEWWDKVNKEKCLQVFHLTQALVEGRVKDKPCKTVDGREPETWGGDMDRARALRLGMVEHECVGVLNGGFSWPAHAVATRAKAVPAYLASAHRVR